MADSRAIDDLGESLIEILISIVILGITVVAIVGAMASGVVTGDVHRKESTATSLLVTAAETLKSSTVTYKPCATPAEPTYATALGSLPGTALPTGWSAPKVLSISYWNGSTFGNVCYDTVAYGNLLRVQQIVLAVASPDARASESFSVIKRDAP